MTIPLICTAPILSKEDFIQGGLRRGPQRCLVGWAIKVFGGDDEALGACLHVPQEIWDTMEVAISIVGWPLTSGVTIANWNDGHSKPILARTWNLTLALLGNTDNNPESDVAKEYTERSLPC